MSHRKNWGATPDEWTLFDLILGLGEDLLPVVSNPNAPISPNSKMKSLGKTPSMYNRQGYAVGIPDWTSHHATEQQLLEWARNPDYGISLIARNALGMDFDIVVQADVDLMLGHVDAITLKEEGVVLPRRFRSNSSKILLTFQLENKTEEFLKRVIPCEHGIIEFLGDRQQFIAAGHHTSGVRYEWDRLEDGIPTISQETFEKIFQFLETEFGIAKAKTAKKKATPILIDSEEPVLRALSESNMVLSTESDGRVHIICPFSHEHTTESAESATTYWPAHTGGYARAAIKCLHAHCADRTFDQYAEQLGITPASDFEDISGVEHAASYGDHAALMPEGDSSRYLIEDAYPFAQEEIFIDWLCVGVLPKGAVSMLYGAPSTGKTFIVLDLIGSISRGVEWSGRRTKKGKVLYVCAEGAVGFRGRLRAYCQEHGLTALNISILKSAVDLMSKKAVRDFIASVNAAGEYVLIVFDTYAACMTGDENSGKDVGVVVSHCKSIVEGTGASVMLIHHSPKSGIGARGHSSLKGACDVEIEVLKDDDRRMLSVTKMKDGGSEEDVNVGFRLREVAFGKNEYGEDRTSCVVEYVDLLIKKGEKGITLGATETVVFDVIQSIYESMEVWPDENYLTEEVKRVYQLRGYNIKRAIENLIKKGNVINNNGIISINA